MNPIDITQIQSSGFFAIKLAAIVLLILYVFYAFIIVRQVKLMAQTIELSMEKTIKSVAFFHFLYAIALLFYAVIM